MNSTRRKFLLGSIAAGAAAMGVKAQGDEPDVPQTLEVIGTPEGLRRFMHRKVDQIIDAYVADQERKPCFGVSCGGVRDLGGEQ